MKFLQILILTLAFSTSGCAFFTVPEEAKTNATNNAQLCDNFLTLMNAGISTREQEQNFIRSCRRAWHAQNFALNNEPLPPDVEAWEAKKKMGLSTEETGSRLIINPSATDSTGTPPR